MPNEGLINEGNKLDRLFDTGVKWLENRGDLNVEKRDGLQERQRATQKMRAALSNKPVFAAFGPSQVGKSYLMKNLLSENGSPLFIEFGEDRRHDFIEDINPAGAGAESTGVVSRFTIDPCVGGDYPVQLRFLEVKDLLIIFTRALIENVRDYRPPGESDLRARMEHLNGIELNGENNIALSVYDIRELRQYLRKKFPNFEAHWVTLENVGYWKLLEQKLDFLIRDINGFIQYFKILWHDFEVLSEQLRCLLQTMAQLSFAQCGHVPIATILRVQCEGMGLIEVDTIKRLGDEVPVQLVSVEVAYEGEQRKVVSVRLDALSALSKEVVLNIQPSEEGLRSKRFLQKADLMDFPGARNPNDLEGGALEGELRGMPFLRGKIAYLFEKYSQDFEMNNLLFCVKPGALDIQDLPEILDSWVKSNVGETELERKARLKLMNGDPLLLITTMWNKHLEGEQMDDFEKLTQRWFNLFNKFIKNEYYAGRRWPQDWSGEGVSFKNYFPLRDFKYSKALFACDENGQEVAINSSTVKDHFESLEDYLENLKNAFLQNDFVQQNMIDPEGKWDAASSVGQDGSLPILEALNRAAEVSGLEHHGKEIFTNAKKSLQEQLMPFLRAADEETQRKDNERFVLRLRQMMMPLIMSADEKLFHLQRALESSPSDFLPFLQEHPIQPNNPEGDVELFFVAHPFVSREMDSAELKNRLANHYGVNSDNIAAYIRENFRVDLDRLDGQESSSVDGLVLNALDAFAQVKLSMSYEFSSLVRDGLDEEIVIELLDQLKNGLRNRKVSAQLNSVLHRLTGELALGNYDVKLIARLISKWWNEYVFECDERFYNEAEIEDLQAIHLFSADVNQSSPLTPSESLEKMFGAELGVDLRTLMRQESIKKQQDWLKSIERIVLMNSGGVVFDQEEQNELRELMSNLGTLDFDIHLNA